MRSHDGWSRSRDAGGDGSGFDFDSKRQRKVQQLCRQAQPALMYAIPGDLADPLLQELAVETVLPAPDASRLLVRLTSPRGPGDAQEILERLSRVEKYLRGQVAAAITRKRAPELTFHLIFDKGVIA
jgi:ribosome-binding factor A